MNPPTYARITKRHAKERWDAGLPVILCPHKLWPGGGFSPGMLVQRSSYHKELMETFDSVVRSFCSYNANCHETGYYAAYYITSDMPPEPLKMVVREIVRKSKRGSR